MTDERKQEQQRKAVESFKASEAGRKVLAKQRLLITQMLAKGEHEEKVKDALCGPYGKFFNEGTD